MYNTYVLFHHGFVYVQQQFIYGKPIFFVCVADFYICLQCAFGILAYMNVSEQIFVYVCFK